MRHTGGTGIYVCVHAGPDIIIGLKDNTNCCSRPIKDLNIFHRQRSNHHINRIVPIYIVEKVNDIYVYDVCTRISITVICWYNMLLDAIVKDMRLLELNPGNPQ